MPDTEFGQYRKSYEKEASRGKARRRLEALFEPMASQPESLSLGKARFLLSPEDTSAFPPEVLNREVFNVDDLGQVYHARGMYDLSKPDRLGLTSYHNLDGLYETLLHELGHARGDDVSKRLFNSIPTRELIPQNYLKLKALMGNLLSDKYADALADSILGRR